jgi:hypothetical protein
MVQNRLFEKSAAEIETEQEGFPFGQDVEPAL